MTTLVIPDIHQKHKTVDKILNSVGRDRTVYLGDYFDAWGSKGCDGMETWLEKRLALNDPTEEFLLGNHDIHYLYPEIASYTRCSGWTLSRAMQTEDLRRQYRDRFKLSTKVDKYWLSHAGLAFEFRNPNTDKYGSGFFPDAWIMELCNDALETAKNGQWHPLLGAGIDRGGNQSVGGITWMDWGSLETITGLNQIVGHTSGTEVREKISNSSSNYCLDTNLNHYALIENGRVSFHAVEAL